MKNLKIWCSVEHDNATVVELEFSNEEQATQYVERAIRQCGIWTDDGLRFIPWHSIKGIDRY